MADDNDPPQDPPPGDPPPSNQPDPAALQAQLDELRQANLGLQREKLQRDNPDLPEAVFAGDDLATVQATLAVARAAADHIRATIVANGVLPTPAPAPAATPAAAGVTRQPVQVPEGLKGQERIRYYLNNRS